MPRRFKVETMLTAEQYRRACERATEPGLTVDQLHAWIAGLGYTIHRSAVYTWFRHIKDRGSPVDGRLILSALSTIAHQQQEILRRQGPDPIPPSLVKEYAQLCAALGRSRQSE